MSVVISRSEPLPLPVPPARLERAEGTVDLAFADDGGRSRLVRAYQQGALKLRFPRVRDGAPPEAVLLNTAGGITGGDRLTFAVELGTDAAAILTTQAAERVYRALDGDAAVDVTLRLGAGARLAWLPQETILFDGGRLRRRLTIEMAGSAAVTLCEAVVLGRTASGETVRSGLLGDFWTLRRDGRLAYADALRLDGAIAAVGAGRATLAGGRAFATLLSAGPDATGRLDAVRTALEAHEGADIRAGASAWDGLLAARIVAADGAALRRALLAALPALGAAVPRVWML